MIIGENTQIEGSLEIWTSATISSAGVGSFQSLEVSPTGLRFPNDSFGGGGDSAGIRLVSRSGENTSLEIYNTNDPGADWINLVVPAIDDAKVNGNTIWNAGNFNPSNYSLSGHTHTTFPNLIISDNGTGKNLRIGDDAWIGDCNWPNVLQIMGFSDESKGYIRFGNDSNGLGYNGSYLTYTGPISFGPAGTKSPNTYSKYVFNVGDNDYNGIDVFGERSDKSVFISLGTQSNSNSTWGLQKRDDGAYGTTVGCFSIEDGSSSFVVERFPITVVAGDSGHILLNRSVDINTGKSISLTKNVNPANGDNPWIDAPILINRQSTSGLDNTNVAGIGFHNQGVNASLFYYDPSTSQFKYRRHGGGTTQTFWDSGNFNPSNYSLTGHTHDDRYYTESEITSFLSAKLNRTPTLSVGSNANTFVTNGAWMGYNITNATTTGWVVIRVYRGPDDAGDVIWQEELDQNNNTTFRRKSVDFGSTWSSWTRFLDTVNDATSISNWNTAYSNTHTHDQTLNTTSNVTFNTVTTSEYKFSSSTSKLGLHGDNLNLKVSLDNSSGVVGLLPQGTVTSANALLGRWDYRWKVVYGGLGNFDSIEEGGVQLSSKYLRLIGDIMTGPIQFGTVGNNAGSPALNFNGAIPTDGYKWIIGDTSNSTGFSIYANGATRSTDGGVNSVNIRSERGSLNLGFSSQTTNLIGNAIQANGNSIWHAGNFDPNTKQNAISKTVFEASYSNGSSTAGWCKLGTYLGNSMSRFSIIITGKAGWNDQNFSAQAIIHGGTNYIASDIGQIAAGCKWNEFDGTSETASQIKLVRQSGYNPYTFDLYILNDVNYVDWSIEVTYVSCSWTTGILWQQSDPGTGTNVFQATKRRVWESGNFDPSTKSDTTHSHNVKDLSWTTDRQDSILNYNKNGITDSPDASDGIFGSWAYHFKMMYSNDPADWQFLLAVDFYTDTIGFRRKASSSWQAPRYLWHDGHFSQTNINNWNTAYTSAHNHANKANLDSINQNLGTASDATFSTLHLTSNGSSNNLRFGDDVLLGDTDWANTVNIKGIQNGNYGYIRFGADTTSLGYNQTSLNYGGRFDVTQLRSGSSTFCVIASTTNSDIWNDQGGSYSIHISNGQGFNFYQGTPGAGSSIAGINSNGTINSQSLTASRVVVSDTSKNLVSSNITTTELGHLAGTSANIQTQINQLATASISGVGAGTINRVSKFTTGTGIGDSNINDDGSTISFLTHITGSTAAFTGGVNVGSDGLRFPDNAFGGGGDFAWIRLISKGGESQSLELYVGNDSDDWVNLVGPDNNFAKVNGNTIWNAGNLTQTSIANWNTAYTSAHNHGNKTNLDSINQNLSTTSQVTFADVNATGAAYIRYGYLGNHSGWVNGTYAMRVYGDSLLLGNATIDTNYQLFVTKDITPTTATNTNYSQAPLAINRTSTTGTSTAAGLGFHNQGINAAFLYYDPVISVFKYNRNTAGALVTIWDDSNFTPGNYLPKSGSFGGSDGYIFEIESGDNTGGLSLKLTDDSNGSEYFVVRNNSGNSSLIAKSDRTVNVGYQNYQQVKPILSIADDQYGVGANSGYLDLYSAGGGFRAFSRSGSSDAVFLGNFWHSGNFNPNNYSLSGHTHQFIVGDRTSPYSSAAPSSWWGDGLYMSRVYNQDYPTAYGNVLSLDGSGRNQIFAGWSGANAGSEGLWFRNKRDSHDGWSAWQRALDTVSDSSSITNWNLAYTRVIQSRIGNYVFSNNDSVELKDRTTNGTSFGRIHNVLGSPGYFNFLMMPEDPSTDYGVIGYSADDDWYVARAGMGANPSNYYKIWTSKDISQTNINNWNSVYNNIGNYSTTAHSHDVKDLAWTTLRYDDILNYNKNGITDSPTGNDGMFGNWAYHFKMLYSADPSNWQFLLGADFFSDSIGFLRKHNGTWQDPRYLWHSGNFNPGNYLPLTGGTMTGNIVFSDADEGVEFRRGAKIGNIGSYLTLRMEQDNNNPILLSNNESASWAILTTRNVISTTNYIPKFVGTGGLNEIQMRNSLISDDGTSVTVSGTVVLPNNPFGTVYSSTYPTYKIQQAAGGAGDSWSLYGEGVVDYGTCVLELGDNLANEQFIVGFRGYIDNIRNDRYIFRHNDFIATGVAAQFSSVATSNGITANNINLTGSGALAQSNGVIWKSYTGGGSGGTIYRGERMVVLNPNTQYAGDIGIDYYFSGNQNTVRFGDPYNSRGYVVNVFGTTYSSKLNGAIDIEDVNYIQFTASSVITASQSLDAGFTNYTLNPGSNINITLPSSPKTNTVYYLNVISDAFYCNLRPPTNHLIYWTDLDGASKAATANLANIPKLRAGMYMVSCYYYNSSYYWTLLGNAGV